MYSCIYVCRYVSVYMCMCIHLSMQLCLYVYVYGVGMERCKRAHGFMCRDVYAYACTCEKRTYVYMYI